MSTDPAARRGSRPDLRLLTTVALALTIVWGVGWVWAGDTSFTDLYLWIGGAVLAILWVVIGVYSQRGPREG